MAQSKLNTAAKVEEIAKPIAEGLGLAIWDVRYVKEGASWFLRIFIDKDGGVNIDDCERMSRAVEIPLDELDLIKEQYFLEVSSPGLFRELSRPEHFEQFKGESITVRLIRPQDGQKEFVGNLVNADSKTVIIDNGEKQAEFDRRSVSKIFVNDEI